jgi:hypothetical protein
MRDAIIAGVRTAVQAGVGAVIAWAANLGLDIDGVALEAFAFSAIVGVVTIVLNKLQDQFAWLGPVLSLGFKSGTPTYL